MASSAQVRAWAAARMAVLCEEVGLIGHAARYWNIYDAVMVERSFIEFGNVIRQFGTSLSDFSRPWVDLRLDEIRRECGMPR